jgi:long-chain fatty acid transport protein
MMSSHGSVCVFAAVLAAAIWMAPAARAGGFRLASQDAFATARGEAFVATADNASAVYYNPAGLSQLKGFNVRGGIYAIDYDVSYHTNQGKTSHIEDHLAGIPQSFMAWSPEGSPLGVGLGVYAPYGGSIRWPDDTGFRSVATKGALNYYRFSPAIALNLHRTLSIGIGAMVDYASLDLEQGIRPSAVNNYFRFKAHGWAAGYNAGILWHPVEALSFGTTFRSSSQFTLKGHTEFEQLPILQPGERSAWADYEFPLTVVCGVSYRPTPKWNIEFNADYTDWSSFDRVTIHQQSPPYPLHANTPVTMMWQPCWMYELGATRYFENGWHVSAGYVFSESAVPDTYYTPLASDMDRHFFSLGAGTSWGSWSVDFAYQLGYGPSRSVEGSKPSSQPGLFSGERADGAYDFLSHAVILTVGRRF